MEKKRDYTEFQHQESENSPKRCPPWIFLAVAEAPNWAFRHVMRYLWNISSFKTDNFCKKQIEFSKMMN